MALKATIFKAQLQIADMDRSYYGDHTLTLARHPSETDERMMVRVVVFALHANEHLQFGKGLSDPDEPDLWRKDLTGLIEEWIELGQPDPKNLLKACGRAGKVSVYGFNNSAAPWWLQAQPVLERAKNLAVHRLELRSETPLAALAQRNMQLQCTVQENQIWLSDAEQTVQLECIALRA